MLHSAYGDYQLRPFKNLHQLVEDTLVVVRSRLKVVFQYALCFADRLERQLLISHRLSPITQNKTELQTREGGADKKRRKIKPPFWIIPSNFVAMWAAARLQIRRGKKVSNFRLLLLAMEGRKVYSTLAR